MLWPANHVFLKIPTGPYLVRTHKTGLIEMYYLATGYDAPNNSLFPLFQLISIDSVYIYSRNISKYSHYILFYSVLILKYSGNILIYSIQILKYSHYIFYFILIGL